MRDDEFAWEPFGSAMVMQLSAGARADGSIVDWQHELWSNVHSSRPGRAGGVNLLAAWHLAVPCRRRPSGRAAAAKIAMPCRSTISRTRKSSSHLIREMPLRTSALRTLGAYGNVFALESFMDEVAVAAGADPVEFRLALSEGPARPGGDRDGRREGRVEARLQERRRARPRLRLCQVQEPRLLRGLVADVAVDRADRRVSVTRVVAAADAGQIINPKGLEMQIEGGIIQSASWTLKEAVSFDRHAGDLARLGELPDPHLPRGAEGRGPPHRPAGRAAARQRRGSQGPAAAAIANAVGTLPAAACATCR